MNYEIDIQEIISNGKSLCVLVVDDNATLRRSVREVLELAGLGIDEAESGKQALERVYQRLPDLILLDVHMPGMGGVSVLKALRNSYSRIQLPIVLLTPSDEPADNIMALDLGANDYISKPIDFDVLWARISNQLMQKQAVEYMQSAKARLEQQVKQRTAELDAINARLKREIKQRARIESRLQKQANYDQLTGLPNRQLAVDRLRQVLIKAKRQNLRPCVAFVDLDNFKYVNDTLGHAAGDTLLREASQRLLECARKSDTVARLGGDEFLLILDDEGNQRSHDRELSIRHVGDRIIESFARPFCLEGQQASVTPSIGFAIYPEDGEDGNVLMRHADVSMYRSKNNGKNLYCFYSPEMTENAKTRLLVESELRKAISRNELHLVYQPVVDIKSGKICMAEALLRWNNAALGEMKPEYFIDVAEETGLIEPIGHWVIQQVCQQIRQWRDSGWPDLSVSINLSSRQLKHGAGLADTIKTALLSNALTTDALQIELTESALTEGSQQVEQVIEQLHQMGVRILLDDFGTGHASLACLQKYHFDGVKIDNRFVSNMLDNDCDSALIKAVIALAGSLDISVVSEGVEHKSQLNFLLRARCQYAQGYYYSKPVGNDEFYLLLRKASRKPVVHSGLELVSSRA